MTSSNANATEFPISVRRARRVAAVLAFGLTLLALSPAREAFGAPAWLDAGLPVPGSESGSEYQYEFPGQPQVAVDARGNAVAAWVAYRGPDYLKKAVWVSERRAGSGWSAPRKLAEYDSQAGIEQKAAIDAAGNAVAVWELGLGSKYEVWAASWPLSDESQKTSVQLSESASNNAADTVTLTTDGGGNAVAAWAEEQAGGDLSVRAAVANSGAWEVQKNPISETGDAYVSDATVSAGQDGTVVAVWRSTTSSSPIVPGIHYAYEGPTDSGWTKGAISTTGGSDSNPDVAVDANGNAVAVWEHAAGDASVIQAAYRPVGGSWSAVPEDLSGSDYEAHNPQVAIDSNGEAVVVWERTDGAARRFIEGAMLPAGGVPTPFPVSEDSVGTCDDPETAVVEPQTAVAAARGSVVVWRDCASAKVYASVLGAEGEWGENTYFDADAPPGAATPQVAVDGGGNALVAWDGVTEGVWTVTSKGYDASAPAIEDVTVPGQGTAGVPVSFAASVFNVWGTTTTTWSFGDGATAVGESVTHTYAEPGAYTVQVSAADGVGASSTETRTVTIQEPQPEPQPGPPPAEPGPGIPPPATESRPSLQIAAAKATVTRVGTTQLKLSCKAGSSRPCAGTLTLKTAAKVKQGKRKRIVTLGSTSYSIAAGKTRAVTVRLSKTGQRLVRRLGRVKIKITATVRDAAATSTATRTIVLTAKR